MFNHHFPSLIIHNFLNNKEKDFDYVKELEKCSNRAFTRGFYFGKEDNINLLSSKYKQTHDFIAVVVEDSKDGWCLIEHRNKFKKGDRLEVLSSTDSFNKILEIGEMKDEYDVMYEEVKRVQQRIYIKTDLKLLAGDILRKEL